MLYPMYPQDQTITAKPAVLKHLLMTLSREKPLAVDLLSLDDVVGLSLADIFQLLIEHTQNPTQIALSQSDYSVLDLKYRR